MIAYHDQRAVLGQIFASDHAELGYHIHHGIGNTSEYGSEYLATGPSDFMVMVVVGHSLGV
jgi:hypothetical protein